jgi:hypothetical protein
MHHLLADRDLDMCIYFCIFSFWNGVHYPLTCIIYLHAVLVTYFDAPLYKFVPSGILLTPFSPCGTVSS